MCHASFPASCIEEPGFGYCQTRTTGQVAFAGIHSKKPPARALDCAQGADRSGTSTSFERNALAFELIECPFQQRTGPHRQGTDHLLTKALTHLCRNGNIEKGRRLLARRFANDNHSPQRILMRFDGEHGVCAHDDSALLLSTSRWCS